MASALVPGLVWGAPRSWEARPVGIALTVVIAAIVAISAWTAMCARRCRRIANEAVAEREKSEAALAASEERMRQILDGMPMGLLVATSDGHPYYANPEAGRLMGRGIGPRISGEGASQEVYQLYVEGSDRLFPAEDLALARAVNGETAEFDDVEVHKPDGTVVPVQVRGRPIFAPDGAVEFALVVVDDISRRKTVERSLAEQAAVLDLAYDAVIVQDLTGHITFWNYGAERTYGFTRAEAVGQIGSHLLRTEFPVPLRDIQAELDAVGSWQGELVQFRRGGERIVVASRWAARRAPDGSRIGWLEVNRDVTAQKGAAGYARSLIEASLDPFVTISSDGKITDVNESTVRATGVPREKLVGTDFSEYFTDPGKARAGYQQVFAEGQVTDYPLTMRHKSGKVTEVLYNASVYRDTAGNVAGVFAAARDITAQREAARYARSLIEANPDPLVTISADGKITDVNESTIGATGVPREELIGTDFSVYFTDPDKARTGYERAFAEGQIADYPLTIRHRTGALTEVLYNASVYRDTAGKVAGVFAAARNITARRRAEEELARRAAELETANRDLARSNADLEQFAYIASHDLAEPLRAISGPLTYVADRYKGQLDEEADEFINFAVDGCARMQSLIDGLLAFSRVGRVEGAITAVDAAQVAKEAISALGPILDVNQAVVTVGPLPTVLAEPGQLSQVFQNLVGNAVKFVAPGTKPHVAISAEAVGDRWRFDVIDNGIGIADKHRDRIFTMFKRLHARDSYPGTGIGLAVVKKIVERHGGDVGVDDAPTGTGSRFWFTLPAAGGQ